MDCLACDIRPVCKVYDAIQPHLHIANISITNCTVKKSGTVHITEEVVQEPIRPERRPEEIAMISDKIRDLSPVKQKTYAECPDCEESYEGSEFVKCQSCKKDICKHCSVLVKGKVVCEECYNKS